MSEPAYKSIVRRKQAQLDSQVPQEWRLPAQWIPTGTLSTEESVTNTRQYDNVNLVDFPRQCGLLSTKQLEITEKWDVKGLLAEIAESRLAAKEVCEAFCKVGRLNILRLMPLRAKIHCHLLSTVY